MDPETHSTLICGATERSRKGLITGSIAFGIVCPILTCCLCAFAPCCWLNGRILEYMDNKESQKNKPRNDPPKCFEGHKMVWFNTNPDGGDSGVSCKNCYLSI